MLTLIIVLTAPPPPYGGILEFLEASSSSITVASSNLSPGTHAPHAETDAETRWMSLNLSTSQAPAILTSPAPGPGLPSITANSKQNRIMMDRGVMTGCMQDATGMDMTRQTDRDLLPQPSCSPEGFGHVRYPHDPMYGPRGWIPPGGEFQKASFNGHPTYSNGPHAHPGMPPFGPPPQFGFLPGNGPGMMLPFPPPPAMYTPAHGPPPPPMPGDHFGSSIDMSKPPPPEGSPQQLPPHFPPHPGQPMGMPPPPYGYGPPPFGFGYGPPLPPPPPFMGMGGGMGGTPATAGFSVLGTSPRHDDNDLAPPSTGHTVHHHRQQQQQQRERHGGIGMPLPTAGSNSDTSLLLEEDNDLLQRLAGAFGGHNIGMPMPTAPMCTAPPPPGLQQGSTDTVPVRSRSSNGVIGKPAPSPNRGTRQEPTAAPIRGSPSPPAQLDGGRTEALLSYLRSHGISPSLAQGGAEDSSGALTGSSTAPSDSCKRGGKAQIAPIHDAQAAGEQQSAALHGDAECMEGSTAVPKTHHRVTLGQRGRIRITITAALDKNKSGNDDGARPAPSNGCTCPPGGNINVDWELPAEQWNKQSASLVASLCRYGTQTNTTNIIAKALTSSKQIAVRVTRVSAHSPDARGLIGEDVDHEVVTGTIIFHAPKAAGHYVFRIYDSKNDESAAITVAASSPFSVDLRGREVATNLIFSMESMSKTKVDPGSINGLKYTFELMRSSGAPLQGKHPRDMIQQCVFQLLGAVQTHMSHLAARDEAMDRQHEAERDEGSVDESVWTKAKAALRVHSAAYECLCALRENEVIS